MNDIDIDAIRQQVERYTGFAGSSQSFLAHTLAKKVPALLAEVDELTAALAKRDATITAFNETHGNAAYLADNLAATTIERDEFSAELDKVSEQLTAANRRAAGLNNDRRSAVKGNTAWANGSDLTADEARTAAQFLDAYIRLCGHRLPADHAVRGVAAKLAKNIAAEAVAR